MAAFFDCLWNDALERFWQWTEKPLNSLETIPAELHRAVMELPEEDRQDRAKVNEAYRRVMEAQ
ncbi:hypothetical protein [Bradyrhizobium cenepequi]|uniref:hypothetical protein n=1 Tax=Bradyrhizobium cenepequi TaxID=2821403 RepID=UPI001CE2ACF2|nr:hypothetical protein [Bradyrhizobium cenepequi]MCA6111081.1 hypothetical protein [Bradyrhizobium cenepequi]